MSIALPLPVGMESRCEILDFEIEDGSVELQSLPGRLNAVLPAGIRVLSAYESSRKIKALTKLRADVTLEYDRGVPDGAQKALTALLSRESLVIVKRSKKGDKEVDIRPLLFSLSIARVSEQELRIETVLSAQNPGLNPQLLLTAIETYLPELKPDFAKARRLEALDDENNLFR